MGNYYTDMEFAVVTLADFIRIVGQNHYTRKPLFLPKRKN